MSKTLIRLIDISIFPTALLIVSRTIGLSLGIWYFGIDWQVDFVNNSLLSVFPVVFEKDLQIISTFVDAFTILVMLMGYGIVTLRAIWFHDSHIDPRMVARLARLSLLGIIKSTFLIYTEAGVWFILALVGVLFGIYHSIIGLTDSWIAISATVLLACLSVLLLRDVEEEISRSRTKLEF